MKRWDIFTALAVVAIIAAVAIYALNSPSNSNVIPLNSAVAPPVADSAGWSECEASPTRACVLAFANAVARLQTARSPTSLNLARVLAKMSKLGVPGEDARNAIADAKRALQALRIVETIDVTEFAIALGKAGALADGIELLRSRRSTHLKENAGFYFQKVGWELRDAALESDDEDALIKLLEESQAMRDAEAIGPNGETICILMGIKPDSDCLQPLSSVAAAMARAGRWTKAVTIARRMRLKLPRVEVLGVIAAALASAGQTEHALQVALETKEDEERLRVLEEMWSPPSGARDVLKPPARGSEEAAKSAFEPSMRLAAKFKIENERDVAFAMIARANAESGGIERALEAEALVTNPKRLAFVRAAIAEAQARAGFRAVSVAMFERARLALQQIGNAEDELLAIARRQAEAGQPDNAFQELQRLGASRGSDRLALDAKWFVDHGRRRSALWSVARAFAGEGRTEEALKIGEQLGSHKHAVELVAGGLARGGRVEAAAKILNDLPEVERERELMMIVRDCEDLGRYEIALRTLRQIPPDTVRAAATARIAVALRERGDSEGARAAAKEALIAARTTHNQHDLVGLLIDVADALPD